MNHYEVILFWSGEDVAWLAEVPDLPGCVADGTTRDEALRNAEAVMEEWMETARKLGREIPPPKARARYPQGAGFRVG